MAAMTSHDKDFLELLRALGAPRNLTSFELTAAVDQVVRVRCTYYPEPVRAEGVRVVELVEHFELVTREEMKQLRAIRLALAVLDERARELQPDGTGYLAIGRTQDHFREEIRAARKAERMPE